MPTYAIGDVQGCYRELRSLLEHIDFAERRDTLWLTGDLVNRGPDSLAVLRAVMQLGDRAVTILGNHDLHLLARAFVENIGPRRRDTLEQVLHAPDRDELLDWLRRRPLVHCDPRLGYTMVHAGLAPSWTSSMAEALGGEVSEALRGRDFAAFLADMYGDTPARWDPDLEGMERLRFITNCLTRMRYVRDDGSLDLGEKGPPGQAGDGLVPWFAVAGRASAGERIVFGHWSTLRLDDESRTRYGVEPLDTGAVWGGALTALRLEDGARFSVPAAVPACPETD